jgi:hypothetical protein
VGLAGLPPLSPKWRQRVKEVLCAINLIDVLRFHVVEQVKGFQSSGLEPSLFLE